MAGKEEGFPYNLQDSIDFYSGPRPWQARKKATWTRSMLEEAKLQVQPQPIKVWMRPRAQRHAQG
jgi:hypothetical protein